MLCNAFVPVLFLKRPQVESVCSQPKTNGYNRLICFTEGENNHAAKTKS